MAGRKKAILSDRAKIAVLEDVVLTHTRALAAVEDGKVRIHLAIEQGVATREIAEYMQLNGWRASQSTVSEWNRQGREALERRRGGDPGRSGGRQLDI